MNKSEEEIQNMNKMISVYKNVINDLMKEMRNTKETKDTPEPKPTLAEISKLINKNLKKETQCYSTRSYTIQEKKHPSSSNSSNTDCFELILNKKDDELNKKDDELNILMNQKNIELQSLINKNKIELNSLINKNDIKLQSLIKKQTKKADKIKSKNDKEIQDLKNKLNFDFTNIKYKINVLAQIKHSSFDKFNYCSIPNDWVIPEPTTELNSVKYKEYLKDGSLLTRVYSDANIKVRNEIKTYLKDKFTIYSDTEFINKVKELTKTNKYFVKTDIIGAYYNVCLEDIYETLKYFKINTNIYNYLQGYFTFIEKNEHTNKFLYITNYSQLLFGAYLKKTLKDINFISRYDDIVIYGNTKKEITTQFNKLTKALHNKNLFLNKNKTVLYDTAINSIFVLKTLINIPSSGVLDDKTKHILKESFQNNYYINIACEDKNRVINSILVSDLTHRINNLS